jgi:hypothetical protein
VLAWQGFSWLKTGAWTALPVSSVFAYFEWPMPSTDWQGLQKIVDSLFDLPTSGAVFVLSIFLLTGFAFIEAICTEYWANRKAH